MCIRDSLYEVLLAKIEELKTSDWNIYKLFKEVEMPLSPVPVSYTHLRAHETVLDIVCRLLLEKKKQHISTIALCRHNYDTNQHR